MSLIPFTDVPFDANLFLFGDTLVDRLPNLLLDVFHVPQHAVDVKIFSLFFYFFELSQGHSLGLLRASKSKILIQVVVLCV